jgi:hypothetical protein
MNSLLAAYGGRARSAAARAWVRLAGFVGKADRAVTLEPA